MRSLFSNGSSTGGRALERRVSQQESGSALRRPLVTMRRHGLRDRWYALHANASGARVSSRFKCGSGCH